jgi:hypothetical protein
MRHSQRYRLHEAECLVAATSCQGDYRGLLVCIAAFWHALARQDEAIEKLLASWEVAESTRQTGQVLAFQPTSSTGGSAGVTQFASVGTGTIRSTPSLSSLANVAAPATTGGLEQGTGSVSARQAQAHIRRNIPRCSELALMWTDTRSPTPTSIHALAPALLGWGPFGEG